MEGKTPTRPTEILQALGVGPSMASRESAVNLLRRSAERFREQARRYETLANVLEESHAGRIEEAVWSVLVSGAAF